MTAKKSPQKTQFADISLEVAHVYLREATPERLRAVLAESASTMKPFLTAWRESGLSVSTTIMVDDYFRNPHAMTGEEAGSLMLAAAKDVGFPVDYVAFEASCAQAAQYFWHDLIEPPMPGQGSYGGAENRLRQEIDHSGWLSNGDPSRQAKRDDGANRWTDSPSVEAWANSYPENNTALALDIEVYKDLPRNQLEKRLAKAAFEATPIDQRGRGRMWSCPFLAAVWQLVRLGAWRDGTGKPRPPPELIAVSDAALSGETPFFALATVNQLPGRMLRIEHAVQSILSQIRLNPKALGDLERGEAGMELIDRVCYVFTSNHLGALMGRRPRS